jgi:hypothetical protein
MIVGDDDWFVFTQANENDPATLRTVLGQMVGTHSCITKSNIGLST